MTNARPALAALLADPNDAAAVPAEAVPEVLCRLAALQTVLAARLASAARTGGTSDAPDSLLTISEAAERLSVSKDWLYRRSRRLPFAVRVGRHVRFSARGIERYIRQREDR